MSLLALGQGHGSALEESTSKSANSKTKVDQVAAAIQAITGEVSQVKMLVDEMNLGSQEQSRNIVHEDVGLLSYNVQVIDGSSIRRRAGDGEISMNSKDLGVARSTAATISAK